MLKQPPLIPTEFSPTELIGRGNIAEFTEHCKNFWKRVSEGKTVKENTQMGGIMTRLLGNGYHVTGLNGKGELVFAVVTKSQVFQKFDNHEYKEILKMTESQQREKARSGFVRIAKKESDWRQVDQREIDYEEFRF
jgi:hypothetical protein